MADLPDRDALLPDRAGPLERAVAKTEARLDDVSFEQLRRVRSVEDAIGAELDHLAAERSVDVYDTRWPEPIRRAVVRSAPLVHVYKGTPYGIATALAAMKVETVITEWWEETPRGVPYTFDVLALARTRLYHDGPVLDARTIGAVFQTVLRTNSEARAFSLRVGALFETELGVAPIATVRARFEGVAESILPIPPARAVLGFAPVATVRSRLGLEAESALPIPPAASEVAIAAVVTVRARMSLVAEAV